MLWDINMPFSWVKPSSEKVKGRTNRRSFIDTIQRKFRNVLRDKKTVNSSDIHPKNGSTLPLPASPSLEASSCKWFAEETHAQPLPLPGMCLRNVGHSDSGPKTPTTELHKCFKTSPISPRPRNLYGLKKKVTQDACGDFATASVSSNSSLDTNDQPESRLFSPQASDYDSGNVTAFGSPTRQKDQTPLFGRRLSKDQGKPANLPTNSHTSGKRRSLGGHVTKLHIPPAGFFSASDSSRSSPSQSPVTTCGEEQVKKYGISLEEVCPGMRLIRSEQCSTAGCSTAGSGQSSGHNSVGGMSFLWPQSRCSPESSPIPSPRLTSPGCSAHRQDCGLTPLHHSAGELSAELFASRSDDGKPKSHKLPLPPVTISSSPLSPPYSTATRPTISSNSGQIACSTVSRWKKGRLIGSGTFGHVYVGFNSETGEMCAMKEVTLFSDDPKSTECVQQLRQEITLLSHLRHPNIVRYFGSETVDNRLFIYLEYVSGGSIHKLLQEYGQLRESAIRSFTRQILSGLAYLHAKNTVHRDIKGANLLVDPNGRVKLADFGMAKHITGHSGPLSFKGSPYWMAPEVIRNSDGSNLAVDIWSLGCTVIEMATAKPPWSQYEGVAALFKVGNSKELPVMPNNLSTDGKDFVSKCLQRDPLDRPTAAQLLEHPFVKNAVPPAKCLLNSELLNLPHVVSSAARYTKTGHVNNISCIDLEGLDVQLSRDFKIQSGASNLKMSKHVSCPVSPIGSPLLRPKSRQPTCRTKFPAISGSHSASGSSTPYKGGSGAFPLNQFDQSTANLHERVGARRPQKRLYTSGSPLYNQLTAKPFCGISDLCEQGNQDVVSCRRNVVGSWSLQLDHRDPRVFCIRPAVVTDHVPKNPLIDNQKLTPSPDLSALARLEVIRTSHYST